MSGTEMRKIINILEARSARGKYTRPVDITELQGRLVYAWDRIARHSVLHLDTSLLSQVHLPVQRKKEKVDAENEKLRKQQRYDPSDIIETTPDLLLEWIVEAANSAWMAIPGRDADYRRASEKSHREYQQTKQTDPDDPYDYVEDSDWLRSMQRQEELAKIWGLVRFEDLRTISRVIDAMVAFAESLPSSQEEYVPLLLDEDLSRGIPILKYVLAAYRSHPRYASK